MHSRNWHNPINDHLRPASPSHPPRTARETTDRLQALLPQLPQQDARAIVEQWLAANHHTISDEQRDALGQLLSSRRTPTRE